jgi:hypothetical protein
LFYKFYAVGAPQLSQNFEPNGNFFPHFVQKIKAFDVPPAAELPELPIIIG